MYYNFCTLSFPISCTNFGDVGLQMVISQIKFHIFH